MDNGYGSSNSGDADDSSIETDATDSEPLPPPRPATPPQLGPHPVAVPLVQRHAPSSRLPRPRTRTASGIAITTASAHHVGSRLPKRVDPTLVISHNLLDRILPTPSPSDKEVAAPLRPSRLAEPSALSSRAVAKAIQRVEQTPLVPEASEAITAQARRQATIEALNVSLHQSLYADAQLPSTNVPYPAFPMRSRQVIDTQRSHMQRDLEPDFADFKSEIVHPPPYLLASPSCPSPHELSAWNAELAPLFADAWRAVNTRNKCATSKRQIHRDLAASSSFTECRSSGIQLASLNGLQADTTVLRLARIQLPRDLLQDNDSAT